jgi:hypothetical protein
MHARSRVYWGLRLFLSTVIAQFCLLMVWLSLIGEFDLACVDDLLIKILTLAAHMNFKNLLRHSTPLPPVQY